MRLRRFMWMAAAALPLFVAGGCSSRQQAQPAESPFRLTATIKDLMDSEVDPSADILWDSVATTVSKEGIDEKAPRTDDDWAMVRHSAITLIEATNLLIMDGRHVAKPGEKAENPQVELAPEQIQTMIDQDRAAWIKFAHGLHDAGTAALKAIDAKNVQGLSDAGEGIDEACEQCHLKYWYPNSPQAAQSKEKS